MSDKSIYLIPLHAYIVELPVGRIVCVVPTGVAAFPEELFLQPEPMGRLKFSRMLSYNIMDRGGHFAAYEEPLLLATDLRQFVAQVEKLP